MQNPNQGNPNPGNKQDTQRDKDRNIGQKQTDKSNDTSGPNVGSNTHR